MIIKGSQRAGAKDLAQHLTNAGENEHIDVHELRGFVSDDLADALREAEYVAKGTKCRQFLLSVSMNPPLGESVPFESFEQAAMRIEDKLGLSDQPRALVFHEKNGRRHAHCVWSRIDAESMTAINLPYYKNRLTEVSREMFLEHGWSLPDGLKDRRLANPLNFSREEWLQAQRTQSDPREIKQLFQECWVQSDSAKAFVQALEQHGMVLARGDRRGFVAVDHQGEVYSLSRWTGENTGAIKDRIGSGENLPDVAGAKERIANTMTPKLQAFEQELNKQHATRMNALAQERRQMAEQHAFERQLQIGFQEAEWRRASQERAARFNTGVKGLWDWMSGKTAAIKRQNEKEAIDAMLRDRADRESLIEHQLKERGTLQAKIDAARKEHRQERKALSREIGRYLTGLREPDKSRTQETKRTRQPERSRVRPKAPDRTQEKPQAKHQAQERKQETAREESGLSSYQEARKAFRDSRKKRGINKDQGQGRDR
ncbi:relaxase/mobilization nuclease domain-containing protein [Roseospirillum parvum]|uniref:MobA/VirD2-like nuclease domain-containing protein n=1 Tax=Roseospirillum parvum TaxID=83401 RepID=A0A1G8GLK6_9PROT|nr:relaxase/mobilization nuclease domain-containing protein [Roseospirillum parvum]SDH95206.1 hypothetical protein SAMN05421742_1312 [Roseospirillum parvum]